MEVKILGTRAHIEEMQPHHQRHTGILIDKKILLDLGEKQFLEEKPKYIFITHLHPDHAYFEFSGSVFPSLRFKIFAPEKHPKVNSIRIVRPFETLSIPGYNITAIPVIHSLKVKSFAYLIETKKRRILFTGDVGWIEKHAREKLGKIDLVITEGSYMRKGGMLRRDKKSGNIFGHTGIPDLVKMFEPVCNHMVIIHLGKWFMEDVKTGIKKIKALSNKNLVVEPAKDGQKLFI